MDWLNLLSSKTQISTFNPSNAEATFFQSTEIQRIVKTSKPWHVGIHLIA